ncbi:prepilin-type N-terminal cleavage/methylation domain-containing protein [Cloacibacillus evryensis]|uniref:prepilin-type N-terminal cleavage/methylation domain-containing protein n=1 Tax=Cloacibacillus evryensis TaxID=508460 RepID=UPI0026DF90A0|nr:prepilin-type N-terminal cleavage/methylation domain-containing protein [Cloacibacillus evryensis]
MMRAYNIKRKKAFSLTELLIVIIIIGVLAGITMLSMSSMDDKLKTNEILENLRMAKEATQNYYTKNGTWPPNDSKIDDMGLLNDRKLGDNYTVRASGDATAALRNTSAFIKRSNLNTEPSGVISRLKTMAREADLLSEADTNRENYKYYDGGNEIFLPVFTGY